MIVDTCLKWIYQIQTLHKLTIQVLFTINNRSNAWLVLSGTSSPWRTLFPCYRKKAPNKCLQEVKKSKNLEGILAGMYTNILSFSWISTVRYFVICYFSSKQVFQEVSVCPDPCTHCVVVKDPESWSGTWVTVQTNQTGLARWYPVTVLPNSQSSCC